MTIRPLSTNERAETPGFTHVASVTADDLTQTTVNTLQTITVATLATTDIIGRVQDYVKTSFQNTADAAFNTTTRSIGDGTGVATHTAAAEANLNGTVVLSKFSNTAVGPYAAANTLTVTFNSMAAKALSNINRGELVILFQLVRSLAIINAQSSVQITKT
jgi:hypothetical protein